jgi:ParB family chromosome partitioning protein
MGSDQLTKYRAKGRQDLFLFDPDDIVLVTEKTHPLYDERVNLPVREWLVKNIMKFGVREPIEVRQNGTDPTTGHCIVECVYGRQRVKAAREANRRLREEGNSAELIKVPAKIVRGNDSTMTAVMITENEQRQDDDIVIKAQKLERYVALGNTMEDAEIVFGVSRDTLENWQRVLQLDPTILKQINRTGKRGGGIPMVVAIELADLPREKQVETLAKMNESGIVAGAAAMDFVREATGKPPKSKDKESTKGKAKADEKEERVRMRTRTEVEALLVNIRDAGEDEQLPTHARILNWVLGTGKLGKRWTGVEE